MSFPEGSKDWVRIIEFLIRMMRILGEVFFAENPDHDKPDK